MNSSIEKVITINKFMAEKDTINPSLYLKYIYKAFDSEDIYNFDYYKDNSKPISISEIDFNFEKNDDSVNENLQPEIKNDSYEQQTSISTAEALNKIELENKRYERLILSLINTDKYESGYLSKIEKYMSENCTVSNISIIKQVALKILYDHLDDSHVIEGILKLLSCCEYDELYPEGPSCCLMLFTNENLTIRNKAIQLFEQWGSKESVKQLETIKCSPDWIQKQLNDVISYLRKYGK